MKDKLNKIKYKKIFETGSEKEFLRGKDVVFLIDTIESQQKEIERLQQENEYLRTGLNIDISRPIEPTCSVCNGGVTNYVCDGCVIRTNK